MPPEVQLALGRIFRLLSRPFQEGDLEEYGRCWRIIMDATPGCSPEEWVSSVRGRAKGAQGD